MPRGNRRGSRVAASASRPAATAPLASASVASTSSSPEKELKCSVCFDDLLCKRHVKIKQCPHKFHQTCLVSWIESRVNRTAQVCPLCRKRVYDILDEKKASIEPLIAFGGTGQPTKKRVFRAASDLKEKRIDAAIKWLSDKNQRDLDLVQEQERTAEEEGRDGEYVEDIKTEKDKLEQRKKIYDEMMEAWKAGKMQMYLNFSDYESDSDSDLSFDSDDSEAAPWNMEREMNDNNDLPIRAMMQQLVHFIPGFDELRLPGHNDESDEDDADFNVNNENDDEVEEEHEVDLDRDVELERVLVGINMDQDFDNIFLPFHGLLSYSNRGSSRGGRAGASQPTRAVGRAYASAAAAAERVVRAAGRGRSAASSSRGTTSQTARQHGGRGAAASAASSTAVRGRGGGAASAARTIQSTRRGGATSAASPSSTSRKRGGGSGASRASQTGRGHGRAAASASLTTGRSRTAASAASARTANTGRSVRVSATSTSRAASAQLQRTAAASTSSRGGAVTATAATAAPASGLRRSTRSRRGQN